MTDNPPEVWITVAEEPSPLFTRRTDAIMRLAGYRPESGGWEYRENAVVGQPGVPTWQQVYVRAQ